MDSRAKVCTLPCCSISPPLLSQNHIHDHFTTLLEQTPYHSNLHIADLFFANYPFLFPYRHLPLGKCIVTFHNAPLWLQPEIHSADHRRSWCTASQSFFLLPNEQTTVFSHDVATTMSPENLLSIDMKRHKQTSDMPFFPLSASGLCL